ncbi:unnamed protein product [Amoebophrya sp. A25]|nr:unnamed protein product [Amoebophrya sp. A25]|eukprot:GSA25T00014597001.1
MWSACSRVRKETRIDHSRHRRQTLLENGSFDKRKAHSNCSSMSSPEHRERAQLLSLEPAMLRSSVVEKKPCGLEFYHHRKTVADKPNPPQGRYASRNNRSGSGYADYLPHHFYVSVRKIRVVHFSDDGHSQPPLQISDVRRRECVEEEVHLPPQLVAEIDLGVSALEVAALGGDGNSGNRFVD